MDDDTSDIGKLSYDMIIHALELPYYQLSSFKFIYFKLRYIFSSLGERKLFFFQFQIRKNKSISHNPFLLYNISMKNSKLILILKGFFL